MGVLYGFRGLTGSQRSFKEVLGAFQGGYGGLGVVRVFKNL